MSKEKPEVQKIVIDMDNAWTEEERKYKEKGDEFIDSSHEKVDYPKRLSKTREFIKNMLEKVKGNNKDEEYWQEVEMDLDCGNEVMAMQRLESLDITKRDVTKWRNAIFEISKESKMKGYFLNADKIGDALYEEFTQRQIEIDMGAKNNPKDYDDQDYKAVLQWQDIASEVAYGKSKNALALLEGAIEDKIEWDHSFRSTIKEIFKNKNKGIDFDIKRIDKLREKITTNSKKLAMYRRIRDSLYAIEFKDKK